MAVLEIDCQNQDCRFCNITIIIFVDDLQLNKTLTCDNCEEVILVVDQELLNQSTRIIKSKH